MQHLNYCRQMTKHCLDILAIPNIARANAEKYLHVMALAKASKKFLMPPNGRVMDDMELRGLDPDMELRLPYEFVALEYANSADVYASDGSETPLSKNVVFAWESDEGVLVQRIVFDPSRGAWGIGEALRLPRTDYLGELVNGRR